MFRQIITKKKWLIHFFVLVLAFLFIAAFFILAGKKVDTPQVESSKTELKTTRSITNGNTRYEVSSRFQQTELTERNIKDKFLAMFELRVGSDQALVTVKKEDNLGIVSSISGKSPVEAMLTNASKVLPAMYPGYREIRQQQFSWAGVNAAEIFFTYTALNGEQAKDHVLIMLKNQDEAIVFTFQSLEKDFDRLDAEYFKPIRDSIKFE